MDNNNDPFGGEEPPAHKLERRTVDVKGREEHESFLRDPKKCQEYGLDIMFERMI